MGHEILYTVSIMRLQGAMLGKGNQNIFTKEFICKEIEINRNVIR